MANRKAEGLWETSFLGVLVQFHPRLGCKELMSGTQWFHPLQGSLAVPDRFPALVFLQSQQAWLAFPNHPGSRAWLAWLARSAWLVG
jgi:hypothetical protein